jgi:hypothetical protein
MNVLKGDDSQCILGVSVEGLNDRISFFVYNGEGMRCIKSKLELESGV